MRPEVVINPPVEHRQWVGDKVDGEFGLAPASTASLDSDLVTTRIKGLGNNDLENDVYNAVIAEAE